MKHRFDRLFQLYKDQNATPEERMELFELIQSGAFDDRLEEDISDTLLDTGPGLRVTDDPIKDKAFEQISQQQRLDKQQSSHFAGRLVRRSSCVGGSFSVGGPLFNTSQRFNIGGRSFTMGELWLAIAVSLILVATTSPSLFYVQQMHSTEKHYAGKGIFTLPDNTKVTLNENSRLTYFTEHNSRIVSLHGEASFDIEYDNTRPFIVQTGRLRTRVIGTAFSVRSHLAQNEIFKPPLDPTDPSRSTNNPLTSL